MDSFLSGLASWNRFLDLLMYHRDKSLIKKSSIVATALAISYVSKLNSANVTTCAIFDKIHLSSTLLGFIFLRTAEPGAALCPGKSALPTYVKKNVYTLCSTSNFFFTSSTVLYPNSKFSAGFERM